MRKFLLYFVIFIVVVAGIAVALPYVVPLGDYRGRIEAAARDATGRVLNIQGPLRIMIFPHFGLRAEEVTFANMPGGRASAMASVGDIQLSIRLLPLLMGRVEVDRITLVKPTVALEVDSSGHQNWNFGPSGGNGSSVTLPKNTAFSGIVIEDGRIAYDNFKTGTHRALDHVDATIDLTRLDRPVAANGTMELGSGTIAFSADVSTIESLLSNGATTFALELNAAALKLRFDGGMTPDGTTEGDLTFSSNALRTAASLLGEKLPNRFRTASLASHVLYREKVVTLSPLRLVLDGQAITGDLELDERGAVPSVSGALAADRFDLNPLLGASAPNTTPGWSRTPIDLSALKSADARLSLTAGSLRLRALRLGRTVVMVTLSDGALTASLNPVTLYGGTGLAELDVDPRGSVPSYRCNLDLRHVALDAFLGDAMGVSSIAGSGSLGLDVTANGTSAYAVMHSLAGNGSMSAADGRIRGVDFGAVARTVQTMLSGNATAQSASTGFYSMGGTFTLTHGILINRDFKIAGPVVQMSGQGQFDIGNRAIDFRLVPKAGVAGVSVGIPFRITGSWDHVHYMPDLAGMVGGAVQSIEQGVNPLGGLLGGGNKAQSKSQKTQNPLKNMFGIP